MGAELPRLMADGNRVGAAQGRPTNLSVRFPIAYGVTGGDLTHRKPIWLVPVSGVDPRGRGTIAFANSWVSKESCRL